MRIVLLTHPAFLPSESMVRFADMLKTHYEARGHTVMHWRPAPVIHTWMPFRKLAKWAGYFDLFLLFPLQMRVAVRREPDDTLFVFCDQALGPWVPLVRKRPHVVHCHDLLTLRAALGDIAVRPISLTGRLYQRFIRRGFQEAEQFICISHKTRQDLVAFGGVRASRAEVVYNGLNFPYRRVPPSEAAMVLRDARLPVEPRGMLLHVGSGAWYKNTAGLIRLYAQYATRRAAPLPLWIVGHPVGSSEVASAMATLPPQAQVVHVPCLSNAVMQALYSSASAMLFPSFAEGFGWPLVEAQSCGCPVLTTNAAPMNEVAGPVARYVPVMPVAPAEAVEAWAKSAASELDGLLATSDDERAEITLRAQAWAARFNAEDAINAYLTVYARVLARRGYSGNADRMLSVPPAELPQ